MNLLRTIRIIVLFYCCFVSRHQALAQAVVTGKVTDQLQAPVPFATIALLSAKDSLPVKGNVTNEHGEYIFENIPAGNYFLKIMSVEFKDSFSEIFKLDSAAHNIQPDLVMSPQNINLDEVAVTVQKKTFEFKNGNITVNVEDSPLAIGNSVYDLLSRMPGVSVDNGNISIQGKQGVSIYIDDRLQQISGEQLINLLRSMNAASVEKIEIIKNPSAKYDAAGSAGIINIKTKKLKITGFSGSAGYTVSKGYAVINLADLSLNYKGKCLAFFSSLNVSQGILRNTTGLDKTIIYNAESTRLISKSADVEDLKYATGNLGLDWYLSKKTTIGIKYQGVPGYIVRTRTGNNAMSDSSLGYNNVVYTRTIPNTFYLANYNFNAEHLFDTAGTRLKFSTDVYGPYFDVYKSNYDYRFTDNDLKEVQDPQQYKAYNFVDLSIVSSRLDFEKKLSKTLNMEAGLKESSQDITSNYTFEAKNNQTGSYTLDSNFTNKFSYREQISAAYLNFQKDIQKINLQLGLRAENTDIHTSSQLKNLKYSRQYLKLFPTLTLNYNKSEKHIFSFAYNRRIYRPDYNSFNPSTTFNSFFSLSRGNPFLVPELTHNLEVSHTFRGRLTNSFSYSRIQNPIRGQSLQNDSSKVTTFQTGNLQSSNEMRYHILFNADLKKWWALTLNLGAYYFDFKGKISGQDLNTSGHSYSAYASNQLMLPKNFKIEISGYYVGPWLGGGFYLYKPRGALNLAVKKTFLNNSLNLSIGLYDAFFTAINRNSVDFQNQHYKDFETYDSRRLNISVSYNFGKLKFNPHEAKTDEDEKARLKH